MCPEVRTYTISVEKLYSFIGVLKERPKNIDKFYEYYMRRMARTYDFGHRI